MTNKRRIILLSSLTTAPAFAAPFLAIGDNAELFLTASAEARYEDNVLLSSSDEVSDEVFTFAPGLEVVFGKSSLTKGSIAFYEDFITYSDETNLNKENDNLVFKSNYEGAKLTLGVDASYRELSQNTRDTAGAAFNDRKVYAAGADAEYALTEKGKLGLGVSYTDTDYATTTFTDQTLYRIPVNYYFAIRPKVDLSAGLTYSSTDLEGSAGSDDYYFNVGARGEFTPKLTGKFTTGYTVRESDAGGNESTWGVDAGLSYAYSEKTSFSLDLSRDFQTGASGEGTENSKINLGVNSQFSAAWSANAGIGYSIIDYISTDRSDGFINGNLGLSYIYNANLNFQASYAYGNNSSDNAAFSTSEFTSNTYSVRANFRY